MSVLIEVYVVRHRRTKVATTDLIRPWKQGRIFYISYRLQFGDVSFGVPVNDAQKSVPLNYFLKGKMQYEQKKYENQKSCSQDKQRKSREK